MLSASDMLRAWERGEGRPPVERAVVLLECGLAGLRTGARTGAQPLAPADEPEPVDLWALPIGTRDALLLTLRERTFGSALRGQARCPACSERLIFSADTRALRVETPAPADALPALTPPAPRHLDHDGWQLRFRLIDSRDLLAVVSMRSAERARAALLARCLVTVMHDGEEVPRGELPDVLPPALRDHLVAALAQEDPQAEILLSLRCPACEHGFSAPFDIGAFLFAEVAAQAQRLLGEVDALARAYGWRESDILALSPQRRRHYLSRVGHE